MRTKITKEWLIKMNACCSEKDMEKAEQLSDVKKICSELLKANRFSDANWLVTEILTKKLKRQYAINAAELVLHIFEKKYPSDNRPRKAIEVAKKYLKNPSIKNKYDTSDAADAAYAAAYAAAAAAHAADTAYAAAYAAAHVTTYAAYAAAATHAAYAATHAAYAAAHAADAAAHAADTAYAAADAAHVAYAAHVTVKTKIINYGIKLIYGEKI